jgi:glycosyltransferase involved in cell wall biosynthesis
MGSTGDLNKHVQVNLLGTAFKIQNTNITSKLPFVLARTNANIIHTMMPTPWSADWSALIAKIRSKKIVVTIHSDLYAPSFIGGIITKFYVETFYRLLLSLSDRVIIVNPDYEKTFVHTRHILKQFDNKIVSIPNGVDIDVFKPINKKKSGTNILFVSILDEYHEFKGLQYLLEAMCAVIKKMPGAKLIVVGEGPLKNKYQKLAKEIGISSHISFVGAKPNAELPNFYANSNVFVLPSINTEAFGIVLLESMACGTPVITTEYAGMRQRIERKNCGSIVPSKNSKALAEAIIKILKNKTLRDSMGKNGRQLVEKNYSWENVARQTTRVYEGMVKE